VTYVSRPLLFQSPRGTRDFLPEELAKRRYAERIIREVFESYGFKEIQTPIFEYFDLYALRSGEKIREDMYVFKGKEREREEGLGVPPEYVLRPELTAPVCRLFVCGELAKWPRPIKVYYIGQCFRYDRPAPGRYREFWQAGIELLGSSSPQADAEVIRVGAKTLDTLGIVGYKIRIGNLAILRGILEENNIGVDLQNRLIGIIDKAVGSIAKLRIGEASNEGEEVLDEVGILQQLDEALYDLGIRGTLKDTIIKMIDLRGSREEVIKKAKDIFRNSEKALKALGILDTVLGLLEDYGVKDYTVDLSVARGLDFYTGTVFEFDVPILGAQSQVCGGGRYDNLIEEFGGPHTPATGYAFGFDRLVESMIKQGISFPLTVQTRVIVAPTTNQMRNETVRIAEQLRSQGIKAETDVSQRSLNDILSYADRTDVPFVLIIGPKEQKEGRVILKSLKERKQESLSVNEATKRLKK
jgi:histidyl-tRNA synthetase